MNKYPDLLSDEEVAELKGEGDRVAPPNGEGDYGDFRAPPIGEAKDARIVLVNAADIEPEPIVWLWRYWLQCGVFNLSPVNRPPANRLSRCRGAPPSPTAASGRTGKRPSRAASSIGAARTA